MRIKQVLNHNAVIAINNNSEEFLLIGKGIGFSKKKGTHVQNNSSVKMYPMNYSEKEDKLFELINEIPDELILIIEDTLKYPEQILGTKLSYTLIFVLASHVHYALKRENKFDSVPLPFDYELNHIFPKEYEAAKYSLEYLRNEHGLDLSDGEIIFFTLHFVNGIQRYNKNNDALKIGSIINDIISILGNEEAIVIDTASIHFSRFLTHIRYFLIRQIDNKKINNEDFDQLSDYVSQKFTDADKICQKLKEVLTNKYNLAYSNEEHLYLVLHTQRLIDEGAANNLHIH